MHEMPLKTSAPPEAWSTRSWTMDVGRDIESAANPVAEHVPLQSIRQRENDLTAGFNEGVFEKGVILGDRPQRTHNEVGDARAQKIVRNPVIAETGLKPGEHATTVADRTLADTAADMHHLVANQPIRLDTERLFESLPRRRNAEQPVIQLRPTRRLHKPIQPDRWDSRAGPLVDFGRLCAQEALREGQRQSVRILRGQVQPVFGTPVLAVRMMDLPQIEAKDDLFVSQGQGSNDLRIPVHAVQKFDEADVRLLQCGLRHAPRVMQCHSRRSDIEGGPRESPAADRRESVAMTRWRLICGRSSREGNGAPAWIHRRNRSSSASVGGVIGVSRESLAGGVTALADDLPEIRAVEVSRCRRGITPIGGRFEDPFRAAAHRDAESPDCPHDISHSVVPGIAVPVRPDPPAASVQAPPLDRAAASLLRGKSSLQESTVRAEPPCTRSTAVTQK